MWFKKASPRRLAIREASEAGARGRSSSNSGYIFLLAGVFFLVACAAQFWPSDPLPYREGELAPTDLSSPVAFTLPDTEKTEQIRNARREESPAVLVAYSQVKDVILTQLRELQAAAHKVQHASDLPPEIQARFPGLTDAGLAAIPADPMFESDWGYISERLPLVSQADWDALQNYRKSHTSDFVKLAQNDTVESATGSDPWSNPPFPEVLVVGRPATPEERALVQKVISDVGMSSLAAPISAYLLSLTDPTYQFSAKLTTAVAEKSAQEVPTQGMPIHENQIIVHAGSRISAEDYRVLRLARDAYQGRLASENPSAVWLSRLGRTLIALILTIAGALYITRMSEITRQLKRLRIAWALCGLLLATLVMAKVVVSLAPQTMYWMGISPTLITAIILVIAYNQRFSLGVSALHGLLVTLTLGQNIDFFLTLLAGVAIFIFGLREIRTRGKLIEVGVVASAALFATVWAVGLARMGLAWTPWVAVTDTKWVALQSLWAAAAGIVVAMFALAALPSIERIFRITTSMTLLELCDLNKPLLQRLSQEAPGTFHHSLSVGILAEAAGNAIGANGLLCRVGAYYHDVGKLTKPQYFVENASPGSPNRHDKIAPRMSLLVIQGHVKDGIELAREYALPWIVLQFIAQHHGTTLVEYFFHAARKRAEKEDGGGQGISETEFRYQGPRPQTREVAIVMICDGCESAVRSIEEPTQGRIEAAVHNLIMKRLLDGQFNECDLTLRELSVIEETLVRALAGVHHGRITYPARSERDEGPGEAPLSQPA